MKIRYLFHKPMGERGVGKAIVAWTWLLGLFYSREVLKYNYSHMEVWLPDEDGDFGKVVLLGIRNADAAHQVLLKGKCFSSTTMGDAEGVRFDLAMNVVGKHLERWEYIECDAYGRRLEVAIAEAERLVGAKYDYMGLFGFFLPINIQDSQRWFCSEICMWFAYLVRSVANRHKRISPRRAAAVLAKMYGEPKAV